MPQSKIRSLQLNSSDFKEIVETALGAPLNITTPLSAGTALTLSGSPVQWTPVSGGGSSVLGGDGITVTGGSPIGSAQTVAVDSTVARTDITTETFSFAGAVSLNLNDTSQAADEDIWRVGATGSNFIVATRTDADGGGVSAISITRTGTAVDDITMPSPLLLTSSGTASTSTALQLNSTNPAFVVNKTNATANQGVWDVTGETDGQLIWRTRTDAFGTGATWLTVNRSGTTVGDIAFTGTRLTFNGVPVKLGSPDTGGGGGGDFVDSGSPISVINPHSLAIDNTLRMYDPGQTDYADFFHDGSTFVQNFVNTSSVDWNFAGTTEFRMSSSNLAVRFGNNIQFLSTSQLDSTSLTQDNEDFFFDPGAGATFGSSSVTIGDGLVFKITQDNQSSQAFGSPDFGGPSTMTFVWGSPTGLGYSFDEYLQSRTMVTRFTNADAWNITLGSPQGSVRLTEGTTLEFQDNTNTTSVQQGGTTLSIRPPDTGLIWIAKSFGSPAFDDVHTGTTQTTLRIGVGSPEYPASGEDVTVQIVDPFGPALALRNSFQDTEYVITTHGTANVEVNARTPNFLIYQIDDAAGSKDTYMSITGGASGAIQFQSLPITDVKHATDTRSAQSSTDAFTVNSSADVYFVACGSPSGGFITIGGITGGVDGRTITIFNTTAGGPGSPSDASNLESITLEHEEATATASNRILCPNRFDMNIGEYEAATLVYDGNVSRWRVMSTTHDLSGA